MSQPTQAPGLLRKVDCVQLPVPDLGGGLAFYRDRLGHELHWRTETAAGLRLGDSELVLRIQRPQPEVDFLVGRVAVVVDPFGNPLTIVDLTRGRYLTDADGNVTGVAAANEAST